MFECFQVKDTHVLKFLDKCLSTVQQTLDVSDNCSDKYKLYESLLRRQKKLKQKSSYNTLDTPIQCKTVDKVKLIKLIIIHVC